MADLPDLALNYKLMHGNSIIDEVSQLPAYGVGAIEVSVWDGQNLICAVDNYYNFTSGQCQAVPMDLQPITYLAHATQ